jgi:lipoprotein-anchoring transpeptidase ErfK/SrfK
MLAGFMLRSPAIRGPGLPPVGSTTTPPGLLSPGPWAGPRGSANPLPTGAPDAALPSPPLGQQEPRHAHPPPPPVRGPRGPGRHSRGRAGHPARGPAAAARGPARLPGARARARRHPAGFLPGELHVDPDSFSLFWTLPGDQAILYACGIGRAGLYEPGEFFVGAKKEWPAWTPTPDMIDRQPELYAQWADGMPGGPDNPLGARALYLFTPERGDTFLRIHGTNAPDTIGTAVSNGCARLVNDQIIDLYERVPLQARVVLHPPTRLAGA